VNKGGKGHYPKEKWWKGERNPRGFSGKGGQFRSSSEFATPYLRERERRPAEAAKSLGKKVLKNKEKK